MRDFMDSRIIKKKRVLILSASSKHHELCVAGLDILAKKLIRLVSDDEVTDGAIPKSYMKNVQIGDVVDVCVVRAAPNACQPENYLVDLNIPPRVRVHFNNADIIEHMRPYLYQESFIFGNQYKVLNAEEMKRSTRSLAWVQVDAVSIHLNEHGKTRVSFWYNGVYYHDLCVTDREFFDLDGNGVSFSKAYFLMSLPHNPWQPDAETDLYFKFVAMILPSNKDATKYDFDIPF